MTRSTPLLLLHPLPANLRLLTEAADRRYSFEKSCLFYENIPFVSSYVTLCYIYRSLDLANYFKINNKIKGIKLWNRIF